jgi:hypothetical protein
MGLNTFTDEAVKRFVQEYAPSYFDIEPGDIGDVWMVPGCDYCDWYVALDARPRVADVVYFLVNEYDERLRVAGVEY